MKIAGSVGSSSTKLFPAATPLSLNGKTGKANRSENTSTTATFTPERGVLRRLVVRQLRATDNRALFP